jgi:hypothetical protein
MINSPYEITGINQPMKPRSSPLQSTRLLDQLRERLQYFYCSLRTEKTSLYWARFFIFGHGLRHPRDRGAPEGEIFLSMLANERKVSASPTSPALSAVLLLYREVLSLELPWVNGIQRPT